MFAKILFLLSALLTLGGAFLVVSTRNIMHACVYLLASLIGMAGLYLTLSADFVAAIQMVVYVGGVVILMVFAVMLTGGVDDKSVNKFGIEKIPSMGNVKTYFFGGLSALVFLLCVGKMLYSALGMSFPDNAGLGFSSTAEEIGLSLVTNHVLAFEISSVLLLGALVGAAIIARPKKELHQGTDDSAEKGGH